jgi:hypothetical protein
MKGRLYLLNFNPFNERLNSNSDRSKLNNFFRIQNVKNNDRCEVHTKRFPQSLAYSILLVLLKTS